MDAEISNRPVVLMVTPGFLEGYPPVQHQVRLLKQGGYHVVVLTTPVESGATIKFGESVTISRVRLSHGNPAARYWAKVRFLMVLFRLRRRYRRHLRTEIAFDADGVFFSEFCPGKVGMRIAHLHEVLFEPGKRFYEKFAAKHLHRFDLVVVADDGRAKLLKEQAHLEVTPLVVPNYPMKSAALGRADRPARPEPGRFRVVYHGSLGFAQALDTVIKSIPLWPQGAVLHLYGNHKTRIALELKELVKELGVGDRVVFEGWRSLQEIEALLPSFDLGLSLLRPFNDNWVYSLGASNKRYQYMQAGIPQVSDDGLGIPAVIEGEGVGLCADPDSEEEIAAIVRHYFDRPEERERAGERGTALHRHRFNYQAAFAPLQEKILSLSEK